MVSYCSSILFLADLKSIYKLHNTGCVSVLTGSLASCQYWQEARRPAFFAEITFYPLSHSREKRSWSSSRLSVLPSVRPSVCPSFRVSVRPSAYYISHCCLVLLQRQLWKNVTIKSLKIFTTLAHVNIQQQVRGMSVIINHVKALASTIRWQSIFVGNNSALNAILSVINNGTPGPYV